MELENAATAIIFEVSILGNNLSVDVRIENRAKQLQDNHGLNSFIYSLYLHYREMGRKRVSSIFGSIP